MNAFLLACGSIVLCIAWFGPWPGAAASAFMPHMAMHVSIVAVAAPLIGAGLVRTRWFDERAARLLPAPVPASLVEFAIVWGWHFPALHRLARVSTGAFAAEQASFLAAGLLLWASALGRRAPEGDGGGVLALLMTSMHMILLGSLLTLAPRPLYRHGGSFAGDALLADQQLGGMLMLLGGGVPYLAGALYLVWRLLQAREPEHAIIAETLQGKER
jgi:putative membrane protein